MKLWGFVIARRFAVFFVALVLVAGVASSASTLAADVSAAAPGSDDVQAYMGYHGASTAAAVRELAELPLVAALQARLSTERPAQFAGLWISHEPSYRIVVSLVDAPAGSAERVAREVGIASLVEQREATYSYAELLSVADNLRGRRMEQDHSVKVDVRANRVVVRTLDPDAYLARADGQAASAASVAVERVPRLGGATIYAGLQGNRCTFGYTVRNNGTYTDGITTAAHCDDGQSYNGTALPLQAASNGSADTQWHTTPNMVDEARFQADAQGTTRIVVSRTQYAQVVVGQTICKFGRTTGYGCGDVEEKEADANWVPNQTGRYISLKRCNVDLSTDGDSGGPVFYNNAAFGIISGWQFGGLLCKDELVFASVSYIEGNLNLTIKTQ